MLPICSWVKMFEMPCIAADGLGSFVRSNDIFKMFIQSRVSTYIEFCMVELMQINRFCDILNL